MATQNLGRVGLLLKGTYDTSASYERLDVVSYNGSCYVSLQSSINILPTNTEYWQLVAEKGNKGDTGEQGEIGNTGNGISSIVKTSSAGLIDTYTITFTDGTTTTFNITNGQDGEVTAEELQDVYEQMSSELEDSTATGTEIDTTGGAYWKAEIELNGNTEQDTNIITYTCDGTETGDYYFVYNSTNYQFTMPTVSSGDVIYFNTDTLKLYLSTTEITTTTASTGTLITMQNTPNPNYTQDIQVVKGQNSVKVENKNLFDFKAYLDSYDVDYTEENDGTLTFATKQSMYFQPFQFLSTDTLISVQALITLITATNVRIIFYSADNTYIEQLSSTKAIIPNITACKLKFDWTSPGTVSIKNFQIEKGSATDYVPHQEQNYPITLPEGMELCKIGNYQDKIFHNIPSSPYYDSSLINGSWYKHSEIGKEILNENSGWNKSPNTQIDRFFVGNSRYLGNQNSKANNFIYSNYSTNIGTWYNNSGTQFIFNFSNYGETTLEQFKDYVANNNIILYQPLKTPTNTEITDTTLINQLNEIENKLKTYQGVTHITQTNEDLPFVLTIDYKKSNLLRIKALEEANSGE